ncbi:LacI family DNA-binding transcriptional regulator [Paenibacillus riograndensis]|uniref:Putative HTH-type transcriptional regulator EndR n=1 Tax=Paenibacillus riograndensis SBR5 TaxID=1073571 RepID=A0A0E4CX44_9BACL|nr:substrate-binding domain-containing protein [Paenibacillus riograndensis]CQR55974.1 putative HTH-type transcriptional regulator EndR [Paenibacillus riograndensis SBR5]
MGKATIGDVAARAGVSKSTVSQFLNKRYQHMGQETRIKIEEAIEALDYRPNVLARGLKQKRTGAVGVIVANIMHRLSTEICRGIEDYCQEQNVNVILCNSDEDGEKEKKYAEMLQAKQVDGIILLPTGKNGALYESLAGQGYPILFMDRRVDNVKADTIVVNNREAVTQAVKHLASLGHRSIALATGPLTISTRTERTEGFRTAMSMLGLDYGSCNIINVEISSLKDRLRKRFEGQEPPTALIAGNDLVLLEALAFVKEQGLRVPEDLALVAFDNIPFAHLLTPTLTTINQPSLEMGRKAAERLITRIRSEEAPEAAEFVFECELAVRESSGQAR